VFPLILSIMCAGLLLGVVFCQPALLDAERLVRIVASAWLCAGLASSVIGLFQYFGAAQGFAPWFNQARYGEAFANLRQRNQFASLTNISLAALVWFGMVFSRHRHLFEARQARNGQMLMVMAAILLACGNATSVSRTGMLQLLLLCVLCGLWGQWRSGLVRWILVAAVLAYAVSVVALPRLAGFDLALYSLGGRLESGDPLCVNRLTLWSNVLDLIALKPWSGWGWGELDYAHYVTLFDGPRFCQILDNAHNLPLQLAVELGVPFAVLVCTGFVFWMVRKKPWRETDPRRQMAWSAMAVILLHSMVEYPLWYGPFQIAFLLCIALLYGRSATPSVTGLGIRWGLYTRAVLAMLSLALLAAAAYAAWDYRRISQIYLPQEAREAAYRTDTLAKISDSWLFADQVMFAHLLITPLSRENAAWTFETARTLLHYSPEPRIAEKIIESAVMLGRDEETQIQIARYRAAFPKEYALWKSAIKAN
ncbi:MAG: Wzy polymerase domain-containing protein, partial [Pseudomonadota bacterium]